MFDLFKKKSKKENIEVIKKRILNLCNKNDYGIYPPPMDSQIALNELCNFFLGKGWYGSIPISQEQVNTIIVYQIEAKYKDVIKG